jgi:5-methylthioadenosine/S-adenosylhomocysteine deaminase
MEEGGADMYDTLITGGHLLTMAGEGTGFVEDGAVAISGGKIIVVGPRTEVDGPAKETIDATNKLVMPGLVDAHMHSSAVLGRGWAQEVAQWMDAGYGPMMRGLDPNDTPLGTLVALMEGVANGTTTFGDYQRDMVRLVRSHIRMGSRGVLCDNISERNFANREEWVKLGWKPGDPTPLDAEAGKQSLERSLAFYEEWDGFADGRIKVIFGPHAADFLSKEMILRIQKEARARGAKLHLHVAQDPRENNATLQRFGLRAIPYLDSIGLLAPDLIAVHISTATEEEVEMVVRSGASMVCCSNSIGIIDGVVPPAALFRSLGGVVALGSDQAPGNNSHNMFSEMRATAMYAKIKAESPLPMPAWQTLRAATIDGAKVLGVDDVTGSLEVGKDADLITLDLTRPPLAPVLLRPARNLVPNLVYAETGSNVTMTMVAGKVIYDNGTYANVDIAEVHAQLVAASERLQSRAAADPLTSSLPIVELTKAGLI